MRRTAGPRSAERVRRFTVDCEGTLQPGLAEALRILAMAAPCFYGFADSVARWHPAVQRPCGAAAVGARSAAFAEAWLALALLVLEAARDELSPPHELLRPLLVRRIVSAPGFRASVIVAPGFCSFVVVARDSNSAAFKQCCIYIHEARQG